ncbi:MAG: YihY/virulence factor BrkB family protein [Fastidiosipilaceae bacterium]
MKQKIDQAVGKIKQVFNSAKSAGLASVRKVSRRGPMRFLFKYFASFSQMDVVGMAASTSYYMLFALFPLMIFLLYLIAVLSQSLDITVLVEQLASILPTHVISVLAGLVGDLDNIAQRGTVWVSLLSLILASAKGFGTMLGNLYSIYGRKKISSNFLLVRIVGVISTLLMGVLMIVIMFVLIFGQTLVKWIRQLLDFQWMQELWLIDYMSYLVTFLILSFVFGIALFISSGRAGQVRYALVVGSLMSMSWIIISFFFSIVLSVSGRYEFLYGGLSGVMLLLLWVFVIMMVIFGGALIHATILREKAILPPLQVESVEKSPSDVSERTDSSDDED